MSEVEVTYAGPIMSAVSPADQHSWQMWLVSRWCVSWSHTCTSLEFKYKVVSNEVHVWQCMHACVHRLHFLATFNCYLSFSGVHPCLCLLLRPSQVQESGDTHYYSMMQYFPHLSFFPLIVWRWGGGIRVAWEFRGKENLPYVWENMLNYYPHFQVPPQPLLLVRGLADWISN